MILDGCTLGVNYKRNTPQNDLKPEARARHSLQWEQTALGAFEQVTFNL